MEINKENLELTKNISLKTSQTMLGADDPQFKRIHHNFHHIVLYIKDYIMKEKCKNYLEIGTHYGHSICNMLQSKYNSKYIGIDIFKRWGNSKITNMEKLANDNVKKFNINNYECKLLKANSQTKSTIDLVKEYFPEGIDLLFIDGDHSYNGIINDFNNYFPLVNKGGYIVFDDYLPYKVGNHERESPKAINKIVSNNKNKILDIGLVDDIVNIDDLKKNPRINLNGKNIDYIIQKL
uniref:Methyltransferase n=1 Tax=viral metagenome TaxID=1070528 RepID=A0A6C0LYG2_9ZZZZ